MKIFSTIRYTILFGTIALLLMACGGKKRGYKKSPVDKLVVKYNTYNNYSIILQDMDFDEKSNAYKHQYQVLYQPNDLDTLLEAVSPWEIVSDEFFDKNKDNLGMAVVTKKEGKLSKVASPPGYDQYVGNEKYGSWSQRSNGTSFWAFYGQYAFMSSLFRMGTYPARYSYWNDYHGSYYGRRPYYGPSGNRVYGTGSNYAKSNSKSTWNSKPNTFKQRVRSKVSKSAAAKKKSRSSSRYRSGSSSRSRSGGFGK